MPYRDNKERYKKDLYRVVERNTKTGGRISWLRVTEDMKELGYEASSEAWRSRWRKLSPYKKKLVKEVGIENIERRRALGEHIEIWFEEGELWCENKPTLELGNTEVEHLVVGNEVIIGMLGDTHIGHKNFAKEELSKFYYYAYQRGVREFYHLGDISDGMYKNRDNSYYEQNAHGFSEQVQMIVDTYPKIEGCKTYFITGK